MLRFILYVKLNEQKKEKNILHNTYVNIQKDIIKLLLECFEIIFVIEIIIVDHTLENVHINIIIKMLYI